jgi:hypothetical protein
MHAFVWEYKLGRGGAGTAQLHDSLAAWRRCASSLRARQSSESWPATAEGYGGLSEPIRASLLSEDRSYH